MWHTRDAGELARFTGLDVVDGRAPRAARASSLARADVRWWKSLFLALFAQAALLAAFQITPSPSSVDEWAFTAARARVAFSVETERPKRPPTQPGREASRGSTARAPKKVRARASGPAADPRALALAMVRNLGLATAGGGPSLLDGVSASLGDLRGAGAASTGTGLRRGGGGGGETLGIGGLSGERDPIGDGVGLPAKGHRAARVIARAPVLTGGLDREEIQRVVKRALPRVRYCYERSLQSSPSLAGKVTVRWTIAGTGAVSVARVEEDTLADPAVGRCIARVIRRLRFPNPRGGGQVQVSYPFVFSAR